MLPVKIKPEYLLSILLLCCLPKAFAREGGSESGGGGSRLRVTFFDLARQVFRDSSLSAVPLDTDGTRINLNLIRRKLRRLAVNEVSRALSLHGSSVDAINYPSKLLIEVNGAGWLGMDGAARLRMVVHEILGVTGYKDVEYEASARIVGATSSVISWSNLRGTDAELNAQIEIQGDSAKRIFEMLEAIRGQGGKVREVAAMHREILISGSTSCVKSGDGEGENVFLCKLSIK